VLGVPPVPVRPVLLVPAPVDNVKVPVRATLELGKNCTLITHCPLTTKDDVQVVLTKLKSVPATELAEG
jgi:hypothetical protein